MEDKDKDDLMLCYVEGSPGDRKIAEDSVELHEEVWSKMKPPRRSSFLYKPFLTARQIEITRTLLTGRNMPKTEFELPKVSVQKISLNQKRSSVKFLDATSYDWRFEN